MLKFADENSLIKAIYEFVRDEIKHSWDVQETGFCIHALNAVYINSLDRWIHLDARGNKTGVDAQFDLEQERLAFPVRKDLGEVDYGIVYANPSDKLMQVLEESVYRRYRRTGKNKAYSPSCR